MKNLFNNIYFFVLFLFFNAVGYAQLYPVQLTPVFNSPYSVKISDYATSMDTKMQLLINPTDISISQRRVRLKLYIQGNGLNIQTSDYAQEQRPIYINGGELQTLTNVDIASLFRLENLQGMTPAQYANPLPEGMYNFCFEMYDFVTNQKISQKSCANLYLILNDPPLLNTPQKNEQIASTEFPNILFTWTPRQINATNISYKFELKQLLDPTLDPQIGFQMSPTLYEETLYGTAVLYNLSMPILTPGLRYAWRVRAISTTGLSENSVFKNDGYSEIYSFKYTASCAAPTFLLSEAQSSKSVKITWEGIPEHTRYQVQYKKQDVRNAQWFSSNSLNRQSLITNLEPGVTYEFRVGSSCDPAEDGVQSFTYSNTSTFTTPTESNGVPAYNCGIVPQINIQNQKPLTNLIQSETFKAGDFPVTILELQGKNSPYSGRGYIIVPYLADTKIAVEFKDIVINTDYQLISGVVETSYNPDWKNVTDVEDFTGEGKGGQIEEKVPFVIKDIVINANGDIVVNGENGEQITIPGGKDTVITDSGVVDKDGKVIVPPKVYTVDSEGNGSNQGVAVAEGGKPLPENTDGVDKSGQATGFTAKGISIAFSGNGSKYAFDVMPDNASAALKKMYAKAGDNVLPYKAVLNGDSDTVIATVKLTDSNIKLDSIVFKTQNGAKIDFKRTDNVFVLTVKGNLSYAEEEILATVKQGKKWQVIGAFMLVHISSKDVNVALVPTYDNSENRLNEIVAKTQEIYSKIGVKINFKKEAVLNIDKVVSGSVIQTEKNTITSTYSAAQQNINALYKGDGNSYVLFITNKEASTGQKGYMRLNGQFGYVFKSADDKIAAHELGHGIFKLEHPFEQYKTADSSTDFLMDYSSGTVLNHLDWKQINDPAFKLYAFQSQSSGESTLAKGLIADFKTELIPVPKSNTACLRFAVGNGKFVKFDEAVFSNFSKISIVDGVLVSVALKDNNTLGKIGGNYRFIKSYKLINTVQSGTSYEVVSTSDLVCADCIKNDAQIAKKIIKDISNNDITTWTDSELTEKYTLLKAGQYTDCSSGICVTIGIDSNGYKAKTLLQTDCDQYIEKNKLFDSNIEVCDATRYTTVVDSQHLKDIISRVNAARKIETTIDTPLSTKKYVLKIGDNKIENEDFLDILEDRFRMLNESTKNKIYLVPLSMKVHSDGNQYLYNKETLDKIAKEVFETCGMQGNEVLLVLPFDNRKDTKCLPLGIAKNGKTVVSDDDVTGLIGNSNWDEKVLQLFSQVVKPLTINSYYRTADGRLVQFVNHSNGNVKGYGAIKILQFFESKGYDEIRKINEELNHTTTTPTITHASEICKDVWECYSAFVKRLDAVTARYTDLELKPGAFQNKEIWKPISNDDIGKFREPFMDNEKLTNAIWANSKESWTWGSKFHIAIEQSALDGKKHFYNFSKLAVLDDIVYTTLDGVGTIPVLDNFTDFTGFVYSGIRGNNENTIIYASSFAIPFAGSVYIKGGAHEAKELWGIVARKADNADGFILDAKKISDIQPNEFHVSSLVYGNEKELTEKVLKDADKYVDKKSVREAVEGIAKEGIDVTGNEFTTLLLKSGEDFTVLTNARKLPGTALGSGKEITGSWLRGTERNAGLFPKSVADKLKGKSFKSFDDFRQQFWKAVADEPSLAGQFDANSIKRMQDGLAPFTNASQQIGGMKNYVLHHKTPINRGGAVYDMDNLYIVTPKYHKEILDPAYHYGYGY